MVNCFTFNCVEPDLKKRLTILCGCKRNKRALTMHTHTLNCIMTLYNKSNQFTFRKGDLEDFNEKVITWLLVVVKIKILFCFHVNSFF